MYVENVMEPFRGGYWKRNNLCYIICVIAVFYSKCLCHIGNPCSPLPDFPRDPQVRKFYSLRNSSLPDAFTHLSRFPTEARGLCYLTGETRERSGCHGEANLKVSHCRPCLPMGYLLLTLLLLGWLEIPAWQRLGHNLTL